MRYDHSGRISLAIFIVIFLAGAISLRFSDNIVYAQAAVGTTQDTFVDPNNPTASFNAHRLETTYSNFPSFVPTRHSLLQFSLSGTSSSLSSASLLLQLMENNLPAGATVNLGLYSVADNWSEATVTANSAPAFGSLFQTVNIAAGFTGQVRFDAAGVGAYLEAQRTGDGVASFLLRLDGGSGSLGFGGNLLFEDREGTADGVNGNEPFIEIPPIVTPPVSTITLAPATPNGNNGWYRTAVHITVSASAASGVSIAETRCVLDPATPPATFADLPAGCAYTGAGTDITSDGQHTLYAASRDNVGNQETPVSQSFKLDQTNPTITGVASPAPNGAGWNNTDVTVAFTCNDATAGIATCSPSQTLTSEGANQAATGTATDNAGNSATTTVSGINIDKSAPDTTITGQPANPSSSASASFTFTGADGSTGSGVASFECKLDSSVFAACTSPQNYSGLTAVSHTFQVRALDRAGNVDATPASYTWTINSNTNILIGVCSSYTVYRTPQGQYVAAGWTGTIKVGTNGNETLNGSSGADLMLGLGGNDTLSGQGGNDVLCGGDGNDLVQGYAGNDYLDGGAGSDVLNGGAGDYDQLLAGDGADTLLDGDGVSNAQGGPGNDAFTISLRKGWRNQSNQTRFEGLTAGYGDDAVGLAILDTARFVVNISGDERDNPPSPLEGTNDKLALAARLDPASQIIKFETQTITAASVQPAITDESGAEYLPMGNNGDEASPDSITWVFLPLMRR